MHPMKTHIAWRWKTTQELPKSRSACTDDADSTITRPTTTSAATTVARSTNSGVDRVAGFELRVRAGDFVARPLAGALWPGRRREPRARVRSVAAGTGVLLQGADGAA